MPSTRRAQDATAKGETEGPTAVPEQHEDEESESDDDIDDEEDSSDRKRKMSPPGRNQEKKVKIEWTSKEDDTLLKAVLSDRTSRKAEDDDDDDDGEESDDDDDWDEIAMSLPDKSPVQCLQRYLKLNSKPASAKAANDAARKSSGDDKRDSDRWTIEEVELLKKLVEAYPYCKFCCCPRPNTFPLYHRLYSTLDPVTHLVPFVPFLQLHHDGMKLPKTLRIELQLIV
jgi:hypothetical protein